LKDNFGERLGGEELDSAMAEEYEERVALNGIRHSSRHRNWLLWKNCKSEAKKLIHDAMKRLEQP
jgi:hypothetical protein